MNCDSCGVETNVRHRAFINFRGEKAFNKGFVDECVGCHNERMEKKAEQEEQGLELIVA